MTTLRLGTFTKSLLLAVAERSGSVHAAGLVIEEVSVVSSPAQFAALASGELDFVLTGPDNVLAYQFIATNPLATLMDLTIYAALDRGLDLGLWCAPGLSPAELPGRPFAVDVATSGFAFVAYELLARLDISRSDLEVVALGATPQRANALMAGQCAATILNASNELRASDAGCRNYGRVTDIGPYLGTVLAGRRGVNGAVARQLRSLLLAAAAWVLDTANEGAALAVIEEVLGLDREQAKAHLTVIRDERMGLVPDGHVDASSLDTLVQLRRRFGGYLTDDDIVDRATSLVDEGFNA
jgi:ABC-type nitrate/sulfonate/bicarbonate transport system substrate-binding protein